MLKPEKPSDEAARLKALHSLDVLDTASEERFDRLTRLAKRMFGVPIALLSLVDENRQWFKSRVGLTVRETDRDISFCGHAILGDGIFHIPDARVDDRFADNPLVAGEPFIRFYAGCPLRYLDGSKLGTLCIIDYEPRALDQEDLLVLQDLSELAEHELAAVQLATLDDLTKISNRRGFMTLAQKSIDICARQEVPSALVFFDLDEFKPINDSFGHAEGDRALKDFASLMKSTFRESDVFGRMGGDEFAVLLTDTSAVDADDIIGRFREVVERHNAEHGRGYDLKFCDGVVDIDQELDRDIGRLLHRADALMYAKKNEGKRVLRQAGSEVRGRAPGRGGDSP